MRLVYLKEQIIYGPVSSRRLGRSLGINLLGSGRKVCTFDCVYCQLRQPRAYPVDYASPASRCLRKCDACAYVQPTVGDGEATHELPSVDAVLGAVEEAIGQYPNLDSLTFSGNGEPTVYPELPVLVEGLAKMRDRKSPGTALTVLSNSSTLWRSSVRRALRGIDVCIMKLDAGDPATFRMTNRPCPGVPMEEVVEGLCSLGSPTLQTLFAAGSEGNASSPQVEAWLGAVEKVRPAAIQIYSLDRVPADASLTVVPKERLAEIAVAASSRTGADCRVY
ncbi:MAG: radical SAM protein [Chloroflexota bacterium]